MFMLLNFYLKYELFFISFIHTTNYLLTKRIGVSLVTHQLSVSHIKTKKLVDFDIPDLSFSREMNKRY